MELIGGMVNKSCTYFVSLEFESIQLYRLFSLLPGCIAVSLGTYGILVSVYIIVSGSAFSLSHYSLHTYTPNISYSKDLMNHIQTSL